MTIIADVASAVIIAQAVTFIILTLGHWRREPFRRIRERVIEIIQPTIEVAIGLPPHTLDPLNDSSTSTDSTEFCPQPCNCRSCRSMREDSTDTDSVDDSLKLSEP